MTEFPLVLYFPDSETRELAIIAIQRRRPDMKIVAVSKDWERFWMPEGAGSWRFKATMMRACPVFRTIITGAK